MIWRTLTFSAALLAALGPAGLALAADAGAANDQAKPADAQGQSAPRNPEYMPTADQVWAGMPDYVLKDRANGDDVYFSDAEGNRTDDITKAVHVQNDTRRVSYLADVSSVIDKTSKLNEEAQAYNRANAGTGQDMPATKGKPATTPGGVPLSKEAAEEEGVTDPSSIKGEDGEFDFNPEDTDAEKKIGDKIRNSPDEDEQDGTSGGFGVMGNDKSSRGGSDASRGTGSTDKTDGVGSDTTGSQKIDMRTASSDIIKRYAKSIVDMFKGAKNTDASTTVSDDQRTYKAAERMSRRDVGLVALNQLDATAKRSGQSAAIGDGGGEVLSDQLASEADQPFSNVGLGRDPIRVRWVDPKSAAINPEDSDKGTRSNAFGSASVVVDR
jgi:hypothetical protein